MKTNNPSQTETSCCKCSSISYFKSLITKSSLKSKYYLLLYFFLLSLPSMMAQITVNSASQFNNLNLSAGDVVVWSNGTYSGQNINFLANGTASNPITLRAETPGGVKFTGSSQLNLAGDYLIVEGFFWDGGTGTSDHVEFRKSGSSTEFANNSILRNCAFDDLNTSGDDKSRWIVMYGRNNTVENCSFLNKRSTGACILVELRYQNGGVAAHQIRNNYFYNFPSKDGRTNSNDSEGIRIGVSSFQTVNGGVAVQRNYFREVDGENEIISNKSKGNIYSYNTFRKSRGSLVLRHGAAAIVDGNYFLGENKAKSGGIRISDSDHVIINNYMQGLNNSGDSFNNGITLMGGSTASGGTSNGYQNVANIVVAYNTIYNSDDPIHFNDSKGSTKPQGELANNLVYSTNGAIVSGDISQIGSSIDYSGNIFGGSAIGISDNGIINANGNFSASGEIFKPSSSGPAANAGTGNFNQVTKDVEGRNRPTNNKDVGAHEVSGGSGSAINPVPITNSNVGDSIGACFLNASGNTSTCSSGSSDSLSVSSVTEYGSQAESKTATITSNINWTVTDNQSWITVSPTSGANNGTISISVSENTTTTTRTGTVTVSGGNLTRTIAISQIGVDNTPPSGTNIALNKNVTATGTADGSNVPSNIVDGSTSTRWSSSGFPKSFTIDLGDLYSIDRTEMVCYNDRAYQFVTEVATISAGPFQQIVNRGSNTTPGSVSSPIVDVFSAVNARFVRVTVSGASGYTGPWVSILEFRVFGELVESTDVAVTGVSLSPLTVSLEEGNTTQLLATVSPSNATNTSVSYSSNNVSVATVNSSGLVTTVSAGQATITVTTNDGGFTDTTLVTVTSTSPPDTLPSPWQTQDIGAVGAPGSASFSNSVFTIEGSGADIWNNADEFRFVYQQFSGNDSQNITVTARVLSVENTNPWAKVGVMIRDDLNDVSKHAMTVVTPGQGVSFQRRTTNGASSSHTTTGGISAPYWVRIEKSGTTFTSSVSTNGTNWTTLGSQTFSFGTDIFVGLAVTSHADGVLCTAVVDNVSVTTSSDPTNTNCVADTNLAANGTIVSFSAQQSANPATNILDGNTSNRWSAQGFPQNAVIDLGDTYDVSQVKLHPYNNRAYQFLVEGSVSSATSGFTTLIDARSNTSGGSIIDRTFNSQSVRYIRLTITGASGYSGVWSSIREFEAICSGNSSSAIISENSEIQFNSGIQYFPNPFQNQLTIKLAPNVQKKIASIRLISLTGRLVYEEKNIADSNNLQLDLGLRNGFYLMQLIGYDGKLMYSKKVIKN